MLRERGRIINATDARETTDAATRCVPFTDVRQLIVAFAGGAVLGALILTRRRK